MNTDSYGQTFSTVKYGDERPQLARAIPQSPDALSDLGKASQAYAEAASAYIVARDNLNEARGRWQECRDIVAKVAEQEGV